MQLHTCIYIHIGNSYVCTSSKDHVSDGLPGKGPDWHPKCCSMAGSGLFISDVASVASVKAHHSPAFPLHKSEMTRESVASESELQLEWLGG
jgi:hypothetical protein